jgi:hypothetical protein
MDILSFYLTPKGCTHDGESIENCGDLELQKGIGEKKGFLT